jgi:hypothetical protein
VSEAPESAEPQGLIAKVGNWLKSVQGIVVTFVAICTALGGLVAVSCNIPMFSHQCRAIGVIDNNSGDSGAGRPISAEDAAARIKEIQQQIAAPQPPKAEILAPSDGTHFSDEWIEIDYQLDSPSGLPIERVDMLVDGGEYFEATGFERVGSNQAHGRTMVHLPKKNTVVALIAQSGNMMSPPTKITLVYDRPREAATEATIKAALPPIATILSPVDGTQFSNDTVEIAYALRSPTLPIDHLDVLADGQTIRTIGFEKTGQLDVEGRAGVTLPRRDVVLGLIARSGHLSSAPVTVKLIYTGPTPTAVDLLKPKLYALLVGVAGYQNPSYNETNSRFPVRDADSFAKVWETQTGGLYSVVETKVVADATQHNVFEGFDWLREKATSRDLAVIFLSGHGFRDAKGNFWFLTSEADIGRLRTTAISNDDLLDLITSLPGKKVLFLDACHSDAFLSPGIKAVDSTPDMNRVVNDFSFAGSGVVVFAASTGTECASERAEWGHSAFAKALIEAIGEGKASSDSSGRITTLTLDLYLEERVKELTGGEQHPIMARPEALPDFPIALARP